MPRPAILSLFACAALALTACSKKQESPPAQNAADGAEPVAASAVTTPAAAEPAPAPEGAPVPDPAAPPAETAATALGGKEPSGTITVQMPVQVKLYPPFYPFSDRLKGIEARTVVRLIVTETGAVESPQVVVPLTPAYTAEVLKAAAQWRFLPALHEGKPLRLPIDIPVTLVSEFGSGGMPPDSPLSRLMLVNGLYHVRGDDGKYAPANLDVVPLERVEPDFILPEGIDELRVMLQFTVDVEGRAVDPVVVESSKTGLDQALLKAVAFWRFQPKIMDGKAVPVSRKLPFKISRKAGS